MPDLTAALLMAIAVLHLLGIVQQGRVLRRNQTLLDRVESSLQRIHRIAADAELDMLDELANLQVHLTK